MWKKPTSLSTILLIVGVSFTPEPLCNAQKQLHMQVLITVSRMHLRLACDPKRRLIDHTLFLVARDILRADKRWFTKAIESRSQPEQAYNCSSLVYSSKWSRHCTIFCRFSKMLHGAPAAGVTTAL
jgi:hypothetical protein